MPDAKPITDVRVRMYCQGIGDCFLLTFLKKKQPVYEMLIDCGLLLGTQAQNEKMQQVAAHIVETTKSTKHKHGHVDLLVVTHEHWDHVSGFLQAKDIFDLMKIDEVWLAWTEDLTDPVAQSLAEKKNKQIAALTMALAKNPGLGMNAGIANLMRFMGIDPKPAGLGAAAKALAAGKKLTTADAMDWMREHKHDFCEPGQIKTIADVGLRAYVLGPPRDLKKLRKDKPTKKGKETYEKEEHVGLSLADRALLSAHGWNPDAADNSDPYRPFEEHYRVGREQARLMPFFQQRYGFDKKDPDSWRRIDDEWSAGLADLALKIDSDTNNTSLALALELPNGKVLLFPGDAQVGNWESWHAFADDEGVNHERTWKSADGSTIKTDELLKRTILYKVGHHGSHNATLRERGLEMMTHPQLVAMIPVDEEEALGQHPPKDGWKMPFETLYERLGTKTHDRILRADDLKADKKDWQSLHEDVTIPNDENLAGTTRPLYVDFVLKV